MAGGVSLVFDLLHVRRDAALATSKELLPSSRETLRSPLLNSELLFGGRFPVVLEQDRQEHERLSLLGNLAPAVPMFKRQREVAPPAGHKA